MYCLCLNMDSFRGQKKLGLRPDWSPLGVYFKIYDEYPHPFHMRIPPPPFGLRRYLHGRQSCFPSSEERCTLFRRSSGPLENILLRQNGENMLLHGLCVYKHICKVLQVKTMTEGYDDRSP